MDATGETILESLMYTVTVSPKSAATVCILKLNAGYEVKTNFRYVIRDVPKEVQQALLLEYNELLKSKVLKAQEAWKHLPVDVMPIEALQKQCKQQRTSFIDTEFPPCDRSIFGMQDRVTFDTAIQWRRPIDFMDAEVGADGALSKNEKII